MLPLHVAVSSIQYTRSEKLAPGGGGTSKNSTSGVDAMTGLEQEGEIFITTVWAVYYTPGRGKIVPRNPNIMFEYLGLAYRDSDYTAVIAFMTWPERKKLVLKLTLLVEI